MARALEKKVIVLIGGTTGLGLSGARACIAAGASVLVVGRSAENVDRAGEQLGPSAMAVRGDAAQAETPQRAIAAAVERWGRIDGVYHVAGGSGRSAGDGPLHECSDGGWEATLRHNLTSLFYTNRAAVRRFLEQDGGGSVLNMGSVLGVSPSPRFFATHAYATAKSAVIGLTRSAAAYYAPSNIRFNVVAPALVDTPMATRASGQTAIRDYIATKQPLDGGRIGVPADLDAAVVYLLSDASAFVTGQVLTIDGGWSLTEGQYSPTEPSGEGSATPS